MYFKVVLFTGFASLYLRGVLSVELDSDGTENAIRKRSPVLKRVRFNSNGSDVVQLHFSKSTLSLQIASHSNLEITPSGPLKEDTTVSFTYAIGNSIYSDPPTEYINLIPNITIPANDTRGIAIVVVGKHAGQVILGAESNSSLKLNDTRVYITVMKSERLVVLSDVIGWIYFVAWSISFYPQVVLNIQRRSVAGLNFDFLALNFVGFLCYSLFNIGLFFIPLVQHEYRAIHLWGIIPVEINDVVFALHALLLTSITILQCFCYERNGQRVSRVCIGILLLIGVGTLIVIGLNLGHVMDLLDVLYFLSYVKLGITIIKYVPQAWFNYRRKSTIGWSIGNILLDFTGGSLSILQMFILAHNNDDWSSLFGNPTKFGLGLFSVLFDVLFIVQHYCLYRARTNYEQIYDKTLEDAEIDERLLVNAAHTD